jgi:hypothetical protein
MDIQGTHSGRERSREAFDERQRALIDANRALVRAAREHLTAAAKERLARSQEAHERSAELRGAARDEIRLTPAARHASEPTTAEREARVRELAEAHRLERLHTPERLERAAQRLLEG